MVLGVLYNVSRSWEAASEALATAASARPGDYTVRNKLGATLANSGRSAEALPHYHAALAAKPRYARGWLNLGISHANLGAQPSAVRCYLRALELNPGAAHIWGYLRTALSGMGRFDLVQVPTRRPHGQELNLIQAQPMPNLNATTPNTPSTAFNCIDDAHLDSLYPTMLTWSFQVAAHQDISSLRSDFASIPNDDPTTL